MRYLERLGAVPYPVTIPPAYGVNGPDDLLACPRDSVLLALIDEATAVKPKIKYNDEQLHDVFRKALDVSSYMSASFRLTRYGHGQAVLPNDVKLQPAHLACSE
jgi:hypothetical protein